MCIVDIIELCWADSKSLHWHKAWNNHSWAKSELYRTCLKSTDIPNGFKRLFAEHAAKWCKQLSHCLSAQYDNATLYGQPTVRYSIPPKTGLMISKDRSYTQPDNTLLKMLLDFSKWSLGIFMTLFSLSFLVTGKEKKKKKHNKTQHLNGLLFCW